jgi:hypothetical protein
VNAYRLRRRSSSPPRNRRQLERRVLSAIIQRPKEYRQLWRCFHRGAFDDPRDELLADMAADLASGGRRPGLQELAAALWHAGPISEAAAARYVAELVLVPPVRDLRASIRRLWSRHPDDPAAVDVGAKDLA